MVCSVTSCAGSSSKEMSQNLFWLLGTIWHHLFTHTNWNWFYCEKNNRKSILLAIFSKSCLSIKLINVNGYVVLQTDSLCNRKQVKWTCGDIFAIEPILIGGGVISLPGKDHYYPGARSCESSWVCPDFVPLQWLRLSVCVMNMPWEIHKIIRMCFIRMCLIIICATCQFIILSQITVDWKVCSF